MQLQPSRRCVIRDLFCLAIRMQYMNMGNFENNNRMFISSIEYLQKLGKANIVEMTCHLTDQNYRCASSVQTIFSVYEQISSFLLFRSHTASTVVRWSTSVVVNFNFHCLVSVYSAPLKADAIFSLNYNRRLSILCTSNYPALQCASTTPFAIALANFAISFFFYFFYFSIQLHLYAAIVYTEKETTIIDWFHVGVTEGNYASHFCFKPDFFAFNFSSHCQHYLFVEFFTLQNYIQIPMENLYGLSISVWNASESTDRLTAHPEAELGFGSRNGQNLVRVRRQTVPAGGSILTVEWEGIHSGVPDDSAISGFTIEYRPENDDNWIQHDGVIPYQGPHYQYRVRIKDLPSGIVYFVRIKVLARNGEVLVQTPEIKAQSETVKIVCNDDITAPRNIRILSSGKHSLTFVWDPPECGNVAKYEYLLKGVDEWALFDVHHDAVTDSETTIRNLLPGTTYSIKVRAVDLTNRLGPWSEHSVHAATEGRGMHVECLCRLEFDAIFRGLRARSRNKSFCIKRPAMDWPASWPRSTRGSPRLFTEPISLKVTLLLLFIAPAVSSEIHVIYKSDKDIRIEWKPYSEYRIQHYEVLISERTGDHEAVHVFRDQIASNETTYLFSDLKPFTEYNIGVIAFAQHEPRLVYRLQIRTSKNEAKLWPILPSVHSKTLGKFSVQWSQPTEFQDRTLKGFFVEYRLRNESTWKPYGDFIPYLPGQKDYNTEITGFSEKIIYAIRVYLVDDSGEVVAVTDEFNVGSESATSCNGAAGVPLDLRTYIVTQNSITFTWSRPTCDENFGPIEGFEYKFWNRKSRNGEPKFPSFVKKDKVSIDRLQPAESYAFKVRSKSRSGHSPWSEVINAQTKPAAEREMGNIFNLRIILAPPRSFLAWTPLPEHRDQVRRFKLSYKLSTSDQWQKFEDFPEEFECPPGIADELNYCYDLSSLQFGVQYTADIAYQLKNGEWSKKGNPLFFILVEAGVPKIPEAPARLTVRFITENTAEISWLPPLSDVKIDEYEINLAVISSSHAGVSPGNAFSLRTPGTTYSQMVDKLHPDTVYNVSITANSRGNHGRAVWEIVGRTPPTFEVKEPKVRQKGDTFIVLWEVAGREQNLCCYQIDARQEHEHEWHTVSGPVNHQAGQRMYSQELSGLRSTARYHIRVRAISFDNYATVATSPAVAVATQCQAPSAPPEDVRVKAVDQNTMLLSWNHPDRSTWGCPDIYYIVEGVVDRQPPQQYQVRADPRGFRVEHRVQSQGGKEWRFRIQTANSYGVSPWTDYYTVQCETETLSSMPQVRIQGDRNQITWYSQGAGSGKVYGYVVECSSGERGWKQEGAIVPFRGDNMLYRVEVPLNRCTLIRVSVIDKNQKVIYSSPEVSAETHSPKEAPSEIVLTAPDPKHVRISWQAPNRETWQCGEVEYEIQVLEPAHIRPIRLNSRANTHVLDSEPNQRWVVQMRTVSRGGSSAWSSSSHVRTPAANELITTPIVFDQQNIPTLTWYSVDGVQELVAFYRVELQRDGDQRWRPISHGDVKYAGSQRPYSVQLTDLRSNEKAQVRVLVIDHNNDIQYTSPAIRVQKNDDCKPPRSYPSDINVEPIGSFKIRVSWKPLTRAEWNCEKQGWYILKYSNSAEQGFRNYSAHNSFAELESSAHTSWEFQLQAANEAGKSPWSSVVTGKTQSSIPGPVLNVRSSSVGANSVQLTWMPPAQPNGVISGYKISYQLLSKGQCEDTPGRVVTLSSKEPRITLQGLHPNSRYKATVTAETTVPGEATSYEFVTDESIPSGAPRAFQATDIRSDRVHLSWQAPACLMTNGDITSFEYELTGADNWAAGQYHRQKTNSNSAEVTGLTGMTKYKGRVRAFTNKGAGPWSEYVIITTRSADSPGAVPMVRIVDAQSDSVMVMWLAPYPPLGRINRYRVQCAPSGSGRWKIEEFPLERAVCPEEVVRRLKTQSTINGQAYCARIGNLSPEQAYDFQVSALGEFGSWGPWSNLQTAKTGSGPVQILNLEKTDVTQNSIGIQWDVASHDQGRIRGFKIVAVPVSRERMVQEYTVDNIITQYRIDGLSGNTMYNITVQARTDSGYHPGPSILVKTELARVVVPPVLSAQGSDSIRVRWIAPIESHSITGYKVEYKTAALPDWRQHGDIIPQSQRKTTFETLIDKLTPNTDVTVRIVTVGSGQRFGIPSKEVSERTFCAAPSSPPQNIRLDSLSPSQIRLNWAAPPKSTWQCDVINYEIAYSTGVDPVEKILHASGQSSEYLLPSAPHTQWQIKMRTTNKVGSSAWSEERDITTKQGAPGRVRGFTLTSISPNEVKACWAMPSEKHGVIVGYDVSYRLKHRLACPDEEPKDVSRAWITVYNVKGLDYTLTGLLPYAEYEVKVRARTTELGPEELKIVQTQPQPPSAPPLDLKTTFQLERSLSFVWEQVECSQRHGYIMNYEYELIGMDDWAKLDVRIANTTDQKVDIDGLTPFTKYVLRVKAYNNVGGGPSTTDLEVMTSKAAAPLPPQDLTVMSEGLDFVAVSWLPPYPPYGPIDSYKLRYRVIDLKRGEGEWKIIELLKSDPSLKCTGGTVFELARMCYNITNLDVSTQYRIQIAAKIVDGDYGVWSSHAIANTLVALPDAPRAITLIGKTDSSLSISWLPPEDPHGRITGFKITVDAVSQNGAVGTISKTYPVHASKREFTIADLEPDTPYNVTVQAATSRGYGPGTSTVYSTDSSVVPALNVPPTMVEQKPNCITVSWTPSSYAKEKLLGYIIEYRKYNEHLWREYDGVIKHDSNKPIYTEQVCGLQPDTSYLFRVKVIDMKSKVSEPSPHLESRSGCLAPTSPPSNVRISALSATEVRITWQPTPPDAWLCSSVNYRLMLSNGTHRKHDVELVSSATDHTLQSEPHTKWTAQIRTENIAGSSHWSEEVSVVTPESAPGVVGNVVGEPQGYDRIKVMWTPPEQPNGVITGYVVSYKLKSMGSCPSPVSRQEEKQLIGEKTILKGLEPASTYEITVRAKTTHDGENSKPIYVTTEEIAPSAAPQSVNVGNVLKTAAALTWEEPPCTKQHGEIIEYEYTVKSEDPWVTDVQTATTNSERVQVVDLVPFTQYSFIVRAVNSKGKGPYSEPVKFLTRSEAPLPPMDLRTDGEFPSAISISFLPPSPPYGILDEYRIRYTPIDRISWHEVRKVPNELSCARADQGEQRLCYRIVGLDPEKEHVVQASAHTESGGWGDWSKSLYAQTKEAEIPVIEAPLRVSNQGPTSLTLMWEGVGGNAARHVKGYVLEYNVGGRSDWIQHNDVILNKVADAGQIYTETVDKLVPDTTYYFRLHVVDRNNRKGLSGPELQTHTLCGKPSMAPQNVHVEADRTNNVHLKWEAVPRQAWHCSNVSYVIKFHNSTHSGYVDLSSTKTEYKTHSEPGVRWSFQVRTQAYDRSGSRSQFSDWSPEKVFTMPGIPELIFIDLKKRGPDSLQLNWHVAADIEDWPHGVDVTYVMRQKGNCPPLTESQLTPITEYNVYEKYMLLQNLEPYSLYEVTVSPRNPLRSDSKEVKLPKASKTVRTGEKAPESAPREIRAKDITENSALLTWDPPSCELQNGEITQYEYLLTGIDEWVQYKFQARAYTSHGHGPWSTPFEIETLGSELGMPREVHPVSISDRHVTLTWLPPYPSRGAINSYRMRYRTRDGKLTKDILLNRNDLSCQNIKNPLITEDSVCYTVEPLNPMTSYQFEVTAVSQDGSQGVWSPSVYVTTKDRLVDSQSGDLTLLYADADSIKVRWDPPHDRRNEITNYLVFLYPHESADSTPVTFDDVSSSTTSYHFKNLHPNLMYNITVKGISRGRPVWFISKAFSTSSKQEGFLDWLPAPTDLQLIEKSDTMLHVSWRPPEILLPSLSEQVTHYRITVAPFDPAFGTTGIGSQYTVPRPGNRIKFDGLQPETIYNVTVQAATKRGYGETLWGVYSTLPPPGTNHILKLKNRTPTSLHVMWIPFWGTRLAGYNLKAKPLWSGHRLIDADEIVQRVEPNKVDHVIRGLTPSTVYNVSLSPINRTGETWGVYATLPPGAFLVNNLKICAHSPYAFSLTWDAVEDPVATHYQVRYLVDGVQEWYEHPQKSQFDLRCPGDPCENMCYLIYNLDGKPHQYTIQVRAFVEGTWNQWKTAVIPTTFMSSASSAAKLCCIVPPNYYVENIGDMDTLMPVIIKPVPNDTYVQRYFVVVDERDPSGPINETMLTDKLTARKMGIPYYVAGSFDRNTLTAEREFVIGNGEVHGGYLNYPLIKGKKYNWAFVTMWMVDGKPVVGMYRDKSSVSSRYIGGWPWWWLLLFLLCLLLLILLICCLFWCCASRLRRRKRIITSLEARQPLLGDEKLKSDMAQNLKALESRIDNIRTQLESKVRSPQGKGEFEDGYVRGFRDANKLSGPSMARQRMDEDYGSMKMDFHAGYVQGLRDAGMQGMTQSMHNLANRAGQGGYSSGYMQGFRDGNSGIFGDRITTTLLRRLEDQYPNQDEFRQGYVEGFKDGVSSRVSESRQKDDDSTRVVSETLNKLTEKLSTLERQTREKGDEIHSTKIYHVYNQLPEGVGMTSSGQYLAQELDEFTRNDSFKRSTLRRHYTPGDYLKYASDTEGATIYPTGSQHPYRRTLSASSLRRDASTPLSGRRTLSGDRERSRHTSIQQYNDTFSRRYQYRSKSDLSPYGYAMPKRYPSQTILDGVRPGPTAPGSRREAVETLQKELSSAYKSGISDRKKMAGADLGRSRLDSERGQGYASDSAFMDSLRRKQIYTPLSSSRRADDAYDSYRSRTSQSRTETERLIRTEITSPTGRQSRPTTRPVRISTKTSGSTTGVSSPEARQGLTSPGSMTSPGSSDVQKQPSTSYRKPKVLRSSLAQAYDLVGLSDESSGSEEHAQVSWTDELMKIVKEPMPETLDRMKKYSTSLSQLPPSPVVYPSSSSKEPGSSRVQGGPVKETITESYSTSYKEEYTTKP
ncbi:Phosphatidylinositol phosphatase PTPRQ [Trichinella sp. T9]|nr:Phosphatidylinositol phosphatase PTPRQ [Trichinella sp. T9]